MANTEVRRVEGMPNVPALLWLQLPASSSPARRRAAGSIGDGWELPWGSGCRGDGFRSKKRW